MIIIDVDRIKHNFEVKQVDMSCKTRDTKKPYFLMLNHKKCRQRIAMWIICC